MFTRSVQFELADKPVSASVICSWFVAEDGMYVCLNGKKAGPAPGILRPTTPGKVTAVVIKAIK